ncbi:metallophosphoesterase [Mangrovimonas sp. DI 80]|uniref:metallophosphoesterase n=1 Tax=Mangrovimonas sp. DI 80 TaxID=1779330 RepID=UPI0009760391|nr:metallophosphoesterase [Mangrovimonas sp. DI 80]OMP32625.1 serine/threonine protein phosphatase [Mangrovimonas sp. DI 80]
MSSKSRLDRAYKNAKVIPFDDSSKFILFSDCHRGDNSFADDFANNRNIYLHALKQYFAKGFYYCELGDGDDLWENIFYSHVLQAHKDVYRQIQLYFNQNRFTMLWGNHDMVYKKPEYVKKQLYSYFDKRSGTQKPLFPGIEVHEAIILKHSQTGQELFLTHGHQADWWNYVCWKWSQFLVRILWKPLNVMGIADPTSPAINYKELIKVERRIKDWIQANNNLITIVGHTHRPRFPSPNEIAFFNDGSCVHPRCITGIEIENGQISLVKWETSTTDDGTLKIVREMLEGPRKLSEYHMFKAN